MAADGASEGVAFEDGPDRGRVIVFGSETHGAYSLMEWTIASRPADAGANDLDYGPHAHADIEEVFVVRSCVIDFLVGETVTPVGAGTVVRVPAGTRHGYVNRSGADAEMLVWFSPGGFEELFIRHRTDQASPPADGFTFDASQRFATVFET
jgi:mannose-6-phosphate isomerase-like protein (cupin superfamily)